MQLYLVRHAIAEERSADAADAERALSPRGRERFARSVLGLQRLGLSFDVVLHSPWRRAAETARLLAPVCAGPTRASRLLAASPADDLLALLAEFGADRHVALVGHEPWLGELLAWLVLAERDLGAGLPLKKGAVAWLEGPPEAGAMVLRALLPPGVLRRIGEPA